MADGHPDGPRRVDLDPAAYDEQWSALAASGADVHGEATLVEVLLDRPAARVLDAGCGTGRVAIRLAERGHTVVGVDVDPALLARAASKAPDVTWLQADLAGLDADVAAGPFDAVVMAGNVVIFLAPGTGATVVANLAARLAPGGVLVSGFQLRPGATTLADYERWTADAGLAPIARYATWDRVPFAAGDYVVAVDRQSTSSKR